MKYDFTLPIIEENPETGELEISIWSRTVNEFRKIIDRKYGGKKDKKWALAIMMYIGLMEDYGMWVKKLPEQKHSEYARTHSGINVLDKNWKPDHYVRAARELYRHLQIDVSPDLNILFAMERALITSTKTILRVNEEMERMLKKPNITSEETAYIKTLVGDLLRESGKISDRVGDVQAQKEVIALLRRQEKKDKIRGGGVAGTRENPEDSLLYRDNKNKKS